MMDLNILDIKFCLLLVFFIGLLTGYFFVRRLSKEEYLPILNKYKKSIKENITDIKNNEKDIQKYNQEVSKIRKEIKEHKQNVCSIEESLLNIEHLYSKKSESSDKILLEIENHQKIEKSLKKELDYYYDMLNKQDKIFDEEKELNVNIENLKNEIENLNKKIETLSTEINEKNKLINTNNNQISSKEKNLSKLKDILKEKKEKLHKDPTLVAGFKLDSLNKELKAYKQKLINLKEKL